MATRREVLEYVIRINGDDSGQLQRLVNQLGQLEAKIANVQSRASQGYINTAGTAEALASRMQNAALGSEMAIARQFLGVTNAKSLRGYKDADVLSTARGALIGLNQSVTGTTPQDEALKRATQAAANALTTRIRQIERQTQLDREIANEKQRQLEEERRETIRRRAANIERIRQERAEMAGRRYATAGAGIGYTPAAPDPMAGVVRTRFGGIVPPPAFYGPPRPPQGPPLPRSAYFGPPTAPPSVPPVTSYLADMRRQNALADFNAIRNISASVVGNRRNRGQDLTNILGRDDYNNLFGTIGRLQSNIDQLDPYEQALLSRVMRDMGIGGFGPMNNRYIGGFSGGYNDARSRGLGRLRSIGEGLKYAGAGAIRGLGSTAMLLGPGLGLAAAYGVSRGVTSGISGSLGAFGQIEGQELFLGGSLGNFFNFGEGLSASENLRRARTYAKDTLVPAVRETAIASPLTYQELFEGYARSSPILFNKGLDPEQALRLTNRIYSVGKASGIKPASIIDDLRALNTGIIRNAQTFQAAGVSQDEFSDLAKLRGDDLVKALDKIFEPFDETIAEYENTYEGKMARLADSIFDIQLAIGETLAPVIQDLATDISDLIKRAKDDGSLQKFANSIAGITKAAIEATPKVIKFFDNVFGKIGAVFGVITADPFNGDPERDARLGALYFDGVSGYGQELDRQQKAKATAELQAKFADIDSKAATRAGQIAGRMAPPVPSYEDIIAQGNGTVAEATEVYRRKLKERQKVFDATYSAQYKIERERLRREAGLGKYDKSTTTTGTSDKPTSKNKGGGSGDSSKSKVGVTIPNLPEADFDFVPYDNSQFDIDYRLQNISDRLKMSSSYINDAMSVGNYSLAKSLLNEQFSLITERTNLGKEYITNQSNIDAIKYNINGAREAAGNQALGVDPFGVIKGSGLVAPSLVGTIGGSTEVVRGTRAEADAARERANEVNNYNKRLQEIRNYNLNEQKRQLELLKLETDLAFESYNIKKSMVEIKRKEAISTITASSAGNLSNLAFRAGGPTASFYDNYLYQDAQLTLNQQIAGQELSQFVNPFSPFGFFGTSEFINAAYAYKGIGDQRANLRRNFLFSNTQRNRSLFLGAASNALNLKSSSIYTTRSGQRGVLQSRIALLEAEANSIRGIDSSRERALAIQSEISNLNQQLTEEEVAFGFAQDTVGFQRTLSLQGVSGITRQRQIVDIRRNEVQNLLSQSDPGRLYDELQNATDPQLRMLAKKYGDRPKSSFGAASASALRAELKSLAIRDQRREAVLSNREDAFNYRLQNQSSDFVNYLNGGTGTATVQESFDRRLQNLRFDINERLQGSGTLVAVARELTFQKESRLLRSDFAKAKAVSSLRLGGGIALAALAAGQDPIQAFAASTPSPIDAGQSFATLFSKSASAGEKGLATQNLGALVGTYLIGQARPNSYSGEGSILGGLIGTALGGPAGTALGTVGGALFGGLFGKKKGPSPEDEARRRFQERLLDLVSGINKSLQQAPDFFRAFSREAIMGSPSRHYSGRAHSDLNMQYNRGSI